VRFNPNGTQVLVASNRQDLKVFDVNSGALVATLANTRRGAFSPDGSVVVGGDYKHLMIWNAKSWEVLKDLPNDTGYVTTVAADSMHDVAALGGSESARLVKLTSGVQLATLGKGFTNFVAINSAGSLVFVYTSRGLAIWDAAGRLQCLKPGNSYYAMAISPDNHWLAAAPANQLTDVIFWDLPQILASCSSGVGGSSNSPQN